MFLFPGPTLWASSSQLPLCWLSVAVVGFAGEGRLSSAAVMLAPVPLFSSIVMISLCCEGQVPCSPYSLLMVQGCLWYKKFLTFNVRQLEVALPSLFHRMQFPWVKFMLDNQIHSLFYGSFSAWRFEDSMPDLASLLDTELNSYELREGLALSGVAYVLIPFLGRHIFSFELGSLRILITKGKCIYLQKWEWYS